MLYERKISSHIDYDGYSSTKIFKTKDYQFLIRLFDVIDKNYAEIDFNIDCLAESMSMSRRHLTRRVKRLIRITPGEYLRNFRLKKSAFLLKCKLYSITTVAYDSGFATPQHFSRCFKAYYGMTPKAYMQQFSLNLVQQTDKKTAY